jgi:hypothetical protein
VTIQFFLILLAAAFIFLIIPGLTKFRKTLGIPQILSSDSLSFVEKIWLFMLGLKTPLLSTLSVLWSFVMTEGESLMGFAWEKFMTHEHAVYVTCGLWFATLWSHFSGLNAAAAATPVSPPPAPPIIAAPKA